MKGACIVDSNGRYRILMVCNFPSCQAIWIPVRFAFGGGCARPGDWRSKNRCTLMGTVSTENRAGAMGCSPHRCEVGVQALACPQRWFFCSNALRPRKFQGRRAGLTIKSGCRNERSQMHSKPPRRNSTPARLPKVSRGRASASVRRRPGTMQMCATPPAQAKSKACSQESYATPHSSNIERHTFFQWVRSRSLRRKPIVRAIAFTQSGVGWP